MSPDIPASSDREPTSDIQRMMDWALAGDHTSRAEKPTEIVSTDSTRSSARPAADKEGVAIGAFTLVRKLGHGGFGEVWEAEQHAPIRRTVALKLIKPGMASADVLQRFDAERQALAMMDHPNIARVFDAGATPDGRPWFAMELVDGSALTDFCDQRRLTIRQRLELFIKVCAAVQHAHQKAVIHRDLKPSNILVCEVDGHPVPKVIDFGIAKALEQPLTGGTVMTLQGQLIGTPQYMSPEQVGMSGDVDTRSDVYSLGVILYELLTGHPPLDPQRLRKAALDEICRIIREEEPPKPSTRIARMDANMAQQAADQHGTDTRHWTRELCGELDWIVMRALEKERERRYQTTGAFADDIKRHLNHEVINACQPGRLYRIRKLVRRNRASVISAGAIILSLVAGAILAKVQQLEALKQKKQAQEAQAKAVELLQQAARSDRLIAHELFDAKRPRDAFAYLARSLEYDSSTSLAAEMAVYAMNTSGERLPVHTLEGHQGEVVNAQFSPNGRLIATEANDDTVKVWDVSSGALLVTLPVQTPRDHFTEFSPDSKRILTHPERTTAKQDRPDYSAWIVECRTGRKLVSLAGHQDFINTAHFSPDGELVVTASYDNWAHVWSSGTGEILLKIPGHGGEIKSAQFSPDGKRIIVVSDDATAQIWDSADGKLLIDLKATGAGVKHAQFSPDGQRIVTVSSDDNPPHVWDSNSGALKATPFPGLEGAVSLVQFSPDGERLVTVVGGVAQIRDSHSGEILASTRPGHEGIIVSVQFSTDAQRIVTASDDTTARLWDCSTGELIAVLQGHDDRLLSAEFSPDGQLVVTTSADKTVRVWENASGKLSTSRFMPEGKQRAMISSPRAESARSNIGPISSDARDDPRLATAVRASFSGVVYDDVRFMGLSPDGRCALAIAPTDLNWRKDKEGDPLNFAVGTRLQVIERSTGKLEVELRGHEGEIKCAKFSSDGLRIVTGAADKTARIWDHPSGNMLTKLEGHSGRVLTAQFSPDASRVVTGSADRSARIWDGGSGEVLFALQGHKGEVTGAQFSPDGRRIITSAADKTARIWDGIHGWLLMTLRASDGEIDSVRFSSDSQRIVMTVSSLGYTRGTDWIWEGVRGDEPLPRWFARFLQLLAYRVISQSGELEDITDSDWQRLRAELQPVVFEDTTRYGEVARWYLLPFNRRPVRPGAETSAFEEADSLINADASLDEVRWAYELNPTHPLVHLALARFEKNPATAEFLRKYDLARLPKNASEELRKRAKNLLPAAEPELDRCD